MRKSNNNLKLFRADTGHCKISILAKSVEEAARIFEQGEHPEKIYFKNDSAYKNYEFKTPEFFDDNSILTKQEKLWHYNPEIHGYDYNG